MNEPVPPKPLIFLRHFAYNKDEQVAILAGLQREVPFPEWKPTTPVRPPLTDIEAIRRLIAKRVQKI